MEIEQAHIDQIRTAFEKMQSKEDLLHVLNEAKPLIYGEKAVLFELNQLTWYANPKLGRKRYAEFKIKKKSGAERCIHAPVKGLKSLQKTLSFVMQCVFEPHNAAMGFVRGRSVVDNAKLHAGSKYVYNIDLKDFFPSIDQARVWKCMQLKPFNLNKTYSVEPQYMKWEDFKKDYLKTEESVRFFKGKGRMFANTPYGTLYVANNFDKEKDKFVLLGSSSLSSKTGESLKGTLWLVNKIPDSSRLDIANIIASLCCTEMEVERRTEDGKWEIVKRNVLPQGAPTSPVITNIVCQKLDFLLSAVAKRFGLKYSRYADDITFSSMHNVYQPESEFLKELHRIISEQNFHIKESKTRLQKDGYRKEVTGLLVNEKANVQQRYIKQLRMWLYYWERYGYERASGFFLQQYVTEKGHIKKGNPDMANVISGKLDYLKMVKGGDNELYLKLKLRFDKLTGKVASEPNNLIEIEEAEVSSTSLMKLGLGNTEQHKVNSNDKSIDIAYIVENEAKPIPVLHKPRELEKLLNKFTQNNHPLKYASHSWADGKVDDHFENYSDFIKKIDESGRPVCFEIQKLKRTLGAKVLHFINTLNENGKYLKNNEPVDYYWGEYRMKFGWKSKELSAWSIDNPSKDPFEFPLPNKTIITRWNRDLEISTFGDVVGLFKSEIEIRPENSDLYNLFVELRRKHLGRDFKVDVGSTLKGKHFYTDVHDFKRALNKIFREISVRTIHPNVSISAENYPENCFTIIEVLHTESYCTEKSSKEMLKEINDGDFSDILRYLENLCDWSVESKFSDGAYRINYLSSSATEVAVLPIEKAEGFKHLFKFYKS